MRENAAKWLLSEASDDRTGVKKYCLAKVYDTKIMHEKQNTKIEKSFIF